MPHSQHNDIIRITGNFPYRMALAGGWIDQPFISKHNPTPPGSMVVVSLEPTFRFMERCGMATGTRQVALQIWGGGIPHADPAELTRILYEAENRGKSDPSGSQDMAGLIYAGINRLDYDYTVEGGLFPAYVETTLDPDIARWLESVVHILPVSQRPEGYNPLGNERCDRGWIGRLGQSGRECYAAILTCDIQRLGDSLNESMKCWEVILPHTVRHPTLNLDLIAILEYYQEKYPGAMYSGCGGGYLYIISEDPPPGTFKIKIRLSDQEE
jgi:hypothetical protein